MQRFISKTSQYGIYPLLNGWLACTEDGHRIFYRKLMDATIKHPELPVQGVDQQTADATQMALFNN